MLLLKFLLMLTGAGLLGGALALVIYDVYRTRQSWRQDQADATRPLPPGEIRWRLSGRLALVSMALAIIVYYLLRPDPAAVQACIGYGGSGVTCPHGTTSVVVPFLLLLGGFGGARKVWRS